MEEYVSENLNVILFDDFETLDAFGPVEVLGRVPENYYAIGHFSLNGGIVKSSQNVCVDTKPFSAMKGGIMLVPGGAGAGRLQSSREYAEILKKIAGSSSYILSVCTGSMLLASAGVLDGKNATTNKMAFDRAAGLYPEVNWIKKARWTKENNIYTASGVSAGIDMALDFAADINGTSIAEHTAKIIEYVWNKDSGNDPFAV
jgi:transcriptional regulator GlxA family with amidase domain